MASTNDPAVPAPEQSASMKATLTDNLAGRAEATKKFKSTAESHAAQVAAVVSLVEKKNARVAAAADRLAEGDAAANAIAEALLEGSKRLAAFDDYMSDQATFLKSVLDGDEDHDDEALHAAMDILPSPPNSDNAQGEAGTSAPAPSGTDKA